MFGILLQVRNPERLFAALVLTESVSKDADWEQGEG